MLVTGGAGCGLGDSGKAQVVIAPPAEKQPSFPTTDLGKLGKPFAQPNLHDGLLVWLGTTKGLQHNPDTLYLMDVKTKKQQTLATTSYQAGQTYLLSPQVNQNWVAWIDSGDTADGHTEFAIFAKNLHTQQQQKVTAIPAGDAGLLHIDLHGDELVWAEMTDHTHAWIKSCKLSSRQTTTVTQVATDLLPWVYRSGDDLVWELEKPDTRLTRMNVFDLQSGKLIDTESIDGRYAYPKIYGHKILYSPQQGESRRTQLALFDLDTKQTTTLPVQDHNFWDIGNGFFTWSAKEGQSSFISVKQLGIDSPPIPIGEGYLPYAMDGNIVWQSVDDHVFVTKIEQKYGK